MNTPKPLKVLQILSSLDPILGGISKVVDTYATILTQENIACEIVCLDSPASSYLKTNSLTIHAIGEGRGRWRYNERLKPWLRANMSRFDVVIINGLWTYHSHATIDVYSKLKKQSGDTVNLPRILVMPHGMLDPYFQRAKDRRLKAIRNWIYWKLIERAVVNRADGLLFTCETELLLARETFSHYHPKKEYNVGYGIVAPPARTAEMSKAFSAKCPGLTGTPYLLFLSRIHPKKGIDFLIEAYKDLYTEFKKAGKTLPRLVIAGPGFETRFGKKLLEQLNLYPEVKESIFFPGMLEGESKWGAFYGCEAFVLPSHQENFGIAVAEALACGKPVLISNQVNIWREIESENGGLINNDTLEGTKEVLSAWLNMGEAEKDNMRKNALNTYHKYFTMDSVKKKIIDVLEIVK